MKKHIVGALLCHPDGRVLLHHRDNKAGISNPNKWALFGGAVETGESSEEAILRELQEELSFEPLRYHHFVTMHNQRFFYDFYLAHIDKPLNGLRLGEGQDFAYVEPEVALRSLDLSAGARATLEMLLIYRRYRQGKGLATVID